MKKVTLTLQNGHRNAMFGNTGTNGEVDLIDKVFFSLAPKLIEKGIEVYYEDDGLWDDDGNFLGLLNGDKDYFIALHFDGAVNPAYEGGFVDDCPKCPNGGIVPCDLQSDQSWKFAQTVADYYFGPMGIRFAPEHRTANSTYYYAFNTTSENTKQFLIEMGTLTNSSDRAKCQDYNKIATLLCQGIVTYLTNNDENYKAYLAGEAAGSNQAQINELRKQLQEAKDAFLKLQQDTSTKLAEKDKQCQLEISRLKQKVKDFANNI